jgi:hypothetical protein
MLLSIRKIINTLLTSVKRSWACCPDHHCQGETRTSTRRLFKKERMGARKKTSQPQTIVYCGISTKRFASIGDGRRKPKQVDREKKHDKADLGKILHPRRR